MVGVIGEPVRHSLSPVLHNAAFRELGLDWVYVAFGVAEGQAGEALRGMKALGIEGLSVTMPHKQAVAAAVDRLTATAKRLGAVNTVVRHAGELVGHNTDGAGFLDALRRDHGFEPAGAACVVFGAGGAARAVILALAESGASTITVVNRTAARAVEAAGLAGDRGTVGEAAADRVAAADLIVNATPIGMEVVALPGAEPVEPRLPLDADLLHSGQVVIDLVYHPAITPLVAAAQARGALASNGLGMLLHQAGHQFRLWTGAEPPLAAMSAAAMSALANSGSFAR